MPSEMDYLRNRYSAALDVIEAAERVIAWMARDKWTQLEKVDGGNELAAALAAFEASTLRELTQESERLGLYE